VTKNVAPMPTHTPWNLVAIKYGDQFADSAVVNGASIYSLLVKGQAVPLKAWTGPEGSSRLRLPDFKTIDTLRW